MSKSVVLLSGGLDSAVCAVLELEAGREVWPLFIDYRQRHGQKEGKAVEELVRHYRLQGQYRWLHGIEGGLCADSVVVPDRNLILCGLASNYAQHLGAERVVIGANATDHAGFPDCRPEFFAGLNGLLSVPVVAPLLHLTKREIVAEARRLRVPIDLTWSCYAGGAEPCGECGACVERERALGWLENDDEGSG